MKLGEAMRGRAGALGQSGSGSAEAGGGAEEGASGPNGGADAQRAAIDLALLAMKRATEVAPEGKLAPKAFLRAAEIAGEDLRDGVRRERLLREIVKRYPRSVEAEEARKGLG